VRDTGMFEHTKRQVKVFFLSRNAFIFPYVYHRSLLCFFLGYERFGFDLGLQSYSFFYRNILNNRSKCLRNGSNRLRM